MYEELVRLFEKRVADATMLMSKVIKGVKIPNDVYYNNMISCAITTVAKPVDRLHNLMTMIGGFKPKKQKEYLEETMEFIVPLLKKARRGFPEQEPIYENIKFIMTNQVILYNEMLKNYGTSSMESA